LSFDNSKICAFTQLNHSFFGFDEILIVGLHQNENLLIKLLLKRYLSGYLWRKICEKLNFQLIERILMKSKDEDIFYENYKLK
jgi:hypothetical protein